MAKFGLLALLFAPVGAVLGSPAVYAQGRDAVIERVGPNQGRRWAVLVGVDDYVEITDLKYCSADVKELAESLRKAGFGARNVAVICDGQAAAALPTKRNVERELTGTLALAGKNDAVVVAFSGHGARINGKSYLCPTGASLSDPANTMISLDKVFELVANCRAAQKLVLVDACRNDVTPPGEKAVGEKDPSEGFGESLKVPPQGAMLLTSCRPSDKSYEEARLGHGVFMNFVLEGLAGKADTEQGNRNGIVSVLELYKFAEYETKMYVWQSRKRQQIPVLYTGPQGFAGDWDLTTAKPLVKPPTAVAPLDTPAAKKHQQAWAEYERIPVTTTNSIGMKFVYIPPGEFTMGSPEDEEGRITAFETQHRVKLTEGFYLGIYEVTQQEWNAVMDNEPWASGKYWKKGTDYPANYVTWNEAAAFCKKLSEKEGKLHRLPTEAEWEYACRAGTAAAFHFGDDESQMGEYDWYSGNATLKSEVYPHRVGLKRPNAWGLYDLHGNVEECCWDWYDVYDAGLATDPRGSPTGVARVSRGGSFASAPRHMRSAFRSGDGPDYREYSRGFRVVFRPSKPPPPKPAPPEPEMPPLTAAAAKERQQSFAKAQDVPVIRTNTIGMKLAYIPPGEFMMGSPASDKDAQDDEKPRRRVKITKGFYMGCHEVTQSQWTAIMGDRPWRGSVLKEDLVQDAEVRAEAANVEQLKAEQALAEQQFQRMRALFERNAASRAEFDRTSATYEAKKSALRAAEAQLELLRARQANAATLGYAATNMTPAQAIEFCKKLSIREGKTYRLPTEAQWEYACRAGTNTRYYHGDDDKGLSDYAWWGAQITAGGSALNERYPHRAGKKRPNAWGLYDMHGNVQEFCADLYEPFFYSKASREDPVCTTGTGRHVLRGGHWYSYSDNCRSANRVESSLRSSTVTDSRGAGIVNGFRVVCEFSE